MIITDPSNGWKNKVNFTDKNDVFVGFDTIERCCEDAGYLITYKEDWMYDDFDATSPDFDGYVFDTSYFVDKGCYENLEEGGHVVFKLVKPKYPDLFLHLYNCHNGYYGHGFSAKINGICWQEDTI